MFVLCVFLLRLWRLSGVGVVLTSLALDWCSGMVSDGFQTQKSGWWISVKERAERVLASEWMCKFCSESKVWTRWRCRRCYHDIPAGLRGKAQAGDRRKDWRLVYGLFDVNRGGRQNVQKFGGREQGASGQDCGPGEEGRGRSPRTATPSIQERKRHGGGVGNEHGLLRTRSESRKKLDEQQRKLQKGAARY